MTFYPLKPGIFPMDILITRNTGGSWKYKVWIVYIIAIFKIY